MPSSEQVLVIGSQRESMEMKSSFTVGIVGATGAVGQELLRLLEDRQFPIATLRLFASARSAGKEVAWGGKTLRVEEAKPGVFADVDVAFFAAGGPTTRALAPDAVRSGCLVIDKSSAFRMDPSVPLVIPEINPEALRSHKGIIANPNCSTAVTLMALWPLHKAFGLKRYTASTYQSVSGTGAEAVRELEEQVASHVRGTPLSRKVYPYQIAFNVIPQVDTFGLDGYTGEETKMMQESRKIMGPVSVEAARAAVAAFPGAELVDEPSRQAYPTPLDFTRKVKCGVGRIRLDSAHDNALSLWVSGDNLWKGAALNALQNAELMVREGLLRPKTTRVSAQ